MLIIVIAIKLNSLKWVEEKISSFFFLIDLIWDWVENILYVPTKILKVLVQEVPFTCRSTYYLIAKKSNSRNV